MGLRRGCDIAPDRQLLAVKMQIRLVKDCTTGVTTLQMFDADVLRKPEKLDY